jgi:CheY-like chemotaxis protein
VVVVALTGWGQDEDRRRSQEAGFDRHLVKPVEPAAPERLLAGLNLPATREGGPQKELDEALRTGRGDDDRSHMREDGSLSGQVPRGESKRWAIAASFNRFIPELIGRQMGLNSAPHLRP